MKKVSKKVAAFYSDLKKEAAKEFVPSIEQKVQHDAVSGRVPVREEIRDWMVRDIKGIYVLLAEVLATPECVDALTEVFYKRACQYHEQLKKQPEIDYNARPGVDFNVGKEADKDGL